MQIKKNLLVKQKEIVILKNHSKMIM